VNLVEKGSISLAKNQKKLPQLPACLKRPLLNDESHE